MASINLEYKLDGLDLFDYIIYNYFIIELNNKIVVYNQIRLASSRSDEIKDLNLLLT